jgi:hypothetical protein
MERVHRRHLVKKSLRELATVEMVRGKMKRGDTAKSLGV